LTWNQHKAADVEEAENHVHQPYQEALLVPDYSVENNTSVPFSEVGKEYARNTQETLR
jgi:hypothetical protein